MLYELTKAAHLLSLFVWIGGMVAVALALRQTGPRDLVALRAYDRAVTSPAMIGVFAFGILLGVQGDWFSSVWLGAKIVLVLVLAGLHGALTGRLRRAATAQAGESDAPAAPLGAGVMIGGFSVLVLIVLLVTLKPF